MWVAVAIAAAAMTMAATTIMKVGAIAMNTIMKMKTMTITTKKNAASPTA